MRWNGGNRIEKGVMEKGEGRYMWLCLLNFVQKINHLTSISF